MSIDQESKQCADRLATLLREAINPGSAFILCDDLPGVLIQIENMVKVLLKERNKREAPVINRFSLF